MSGRPARVLIVAGEASGDLYGGLLMQAMRGKAADSPPPMAGADGRRVEFTGTGGPAMRAAGLVPVGDAGTLGVTGFTEVLGNLRRIWGVYRAARALLTSAAHRPDLAILIDYPDFNLKLARHCRAAGVPVLYFVSPQVWAWRRGRVRQIAARVDRMLVILPFEEEFYRRAGVAVTFVGHPLLDLIAVERSRAQALPLLGLDRLRPTVALLPGSRHNELRSLLPSMLGAARLLRGEFRDLQFVLPVAPTLRREEVACIVALEERAAADPATDPRPVLVEEHRYDAVAASDAAVVASGTATLETALLGVPMVIVYRMNPLTFALARALTDVPHVGMANLIAGRRIVPELVQGDCRPEAISREVRGILTEPSRADQMRRELATVRARLGAPGAIDRAAAAAWGMIGAPRAADRAGDGATG